MQRLHTFLSSLVSILAGLAALLPNTILAQNPADSYPSRPVSIVIPFGAGSAPDIAARFWSKPLTESLGRPFVVDLKPGAGGNIAALSVARAAPDGHTLFLITGTFTMLPAFGKLPFDAEKDFKSVSLLSLRGILLVVTPSLPVSSFAEYLAYAKANPGKLNWGDQGAGTSFHLAGELLGSMTGTKVTFIHYKGSAQNYADLVAGRIQVSPMSMVSALQFLKTGKVRPIAQLTANRSRFMPDLPTASEMGVAGFDHSSWQGLLTTAGTPAAIVNKLNGPIASFAKSPAALSFAEKNGEELVGSTPEVLERRIVTEIANWRKVVKDNNITKQP